MSNDQVKWAAAHDLPSETVETAAPLERLVGQESSLTQQESIKKRRSFIGAAIAGALGFFGLGRSSQAHSEAAPNTELNDLRVKEFNSPHHQTNAFYTTGYNWHMDIKNPRYYPDSLSLTLDIADVGLLYWYYHSSDELEVLIKRAIKDGNMVVKKDNGAIQIERGIWKDNLIGGEFHAQSLQ